jgi:hypothetical protein
MGDQAATAADVGDLTDYAAIDCFRSRMTK